MSSKTLSDAESVPLPTSSETELVSTCVYFGESRSGLVHEVRKRISSKLLKSNDKDLREGITYTLASWQTVYSSSEFSKIFRKYVLSKDQDNQESKYNNVGQMKSYLDKQSQIFEGMREKLYSQYADMYVRFEDGKVLDAGHSEVELLDRLPEDFDPLQAVFIAKVTFESKNIVFIPTPVIGR